MDKMDEKMDNGFSINEMLENTKDIRVKAMMSTDTKKDIHKFLTLIIAAKPLGADNNLMDNTLSSIIVKLEESLETENLTLTVGETSLLESIITLTGGSSSGIMEVDQETNIVRESSVASNKGKTISKVISENEGEEPSQFLMPESDTIN